MKRYSALWIPTEFHRDISCRDNIELPMVVNISDERDDRYEISIDLEKENHTIIIESKLHEYRIELKRVDYSRNGIFLYEYEDFVMESGNEFIGDRFPLVLYNCIKSIYHRHEHHDENDDAMISPYVYPRTQKEQPKIKEKDNEALLHYLSCYEEKYECYNNFISMFYEDLTKRVHSSKSILKLHKKMYRDICNLLSDAKGEEIYYNTLHKSRYNSQFHSKLFSDSSRTAFNIENHIEKIKYTEKKIFDEFNIHHNATAFRWALLIFVIGTALSIAVSVFS